MASRVKRAATSATRPAPAVMTMNWTITRIRKTTRPTITLPPSTNEPKACTTLPAWPWSRIWRVTETLIASRSSVVKSRSDGNTDSSRASFVYIEISTTTRASERLTVIRRSIRTVGSGSTIITTTTTTAKATNRSL